MKTIYPIILIFNFIYCNSQTILYKELIKNVNMNNEKVIYKNTNVKNFRITEPIIEDEIFKNIIKQRVSVNKKQKFCNSNDVNCEIYLNYKVEHMSTNLLSLITSYYTMFRMPRDVDNQLHVNILLFKDKIYEVKVKKSKLLYKKVIEKIKSKKINSECKFIYDDCELEFYISNHKAIITLYTDKVCSAKIPYLLQYKDLTFREIKF